MLKKMMTRSGIITVIATVFLLGTLTVGTVLAQSPDDDQTEAEAEEADLDDVEEEEEEHEDDIDDMDDVENQVEQDGEFDGEF